MAKVSFSARKDPLLRPRRTPDTPDRTREKTAEGRTEAGRSQPARSAARGPSSTRARALETLNGVAAVSATPTDPALASAPVKQPPAHTPIADGAGQPDVRPAAARARRVARRVQTSFSLAPDVWETLDDLAEDAGAGTGQLLAAILHDALPETPAAALAAVERLLLETPEDDELHEERNYRLAHELRSRLDALAAKLGSSRRLQRSLLVRAVLAGHIPHNGQQVRELLTAQRLNAMRAAVADDA